SLAAGEGPPPPRPITANDRAFTRMVRNAMFQRVQLAARDDVHGLAQLEAAAAALTDPPGRVTMNGAAWEEALGAYWAEYPSMGSGPDARSPELLIVDRSGAGAASSPRTWTVRQIVEDPEEHRDFQLVAIVDLDASDAAGEPVVRTVSFRTDQLGA
ncbi:MAG: box helicase domain protein, partial [Solirubrobacterales bacterium]|nr:box helicase domain protein [Solirubrobacterales bacterium]